MKCPECSRKDKVVISAVDGYSQDIRECGYCGAVWTFKQKDRILIKSAKTTAHVKSFTFPPVLDHTKFSSYDDEFLAEDQKVWFS